MTLPTPPNITAGQIALDPVNGIVYYVDNNGNKVSTTWSWLRNDLSEIRTDDNVTITGDLTVSGTTVSVNVESVSVADNILILNSNVTGIPSENAGIEIERGSSDNVQIRWNESLDKWQFTNDGSTFYDINSIIENSVTLGFHTVGDYVKNLTAGSGISISNNSGEGATPSISLNANLDLLTDVVVPSPIAGEILSYNGTNWVNSENYAESTRHYVKNDSGITLSAGTAVYTYGANGTNILVRPAQANTEATSATVAGLLATSLANNGIGYVVTQGIVSGLNTSAATVGDPVWLSPSVAGGLVYGIANKPSAPNHLVYLGTVTRVNANNGEIFVHILNGWELEELHNVQISSPANGDFLRYNGSVWINDPVNLATDTIGDYVQSLVAGTGISVTNNTGEGTTPTVAIDSTVATLTGSQTLTNKTISGSSNTLTNIANSSLTNSSITVGSTSISLGATSTTLSGLTSVAATTFTGALSGNASTASALQTSRTIALGGDLSGSASFDGSANITITATINSDSVALGTDTTGSYVQSLVAGTGVTLTNNSGEGATPTIAIGQAVSTTSNVTFNDLIVSGNLTVNGTTTTINSTVVSVDDITFELGAVTTPTDTTAAGGGIVLKGASDKSITWGSSVNNYWTSTESFNVASGKTFKIAGTDVLSGSTLGSGITSSSLTSVGTVTSGTWSASFGAVSGANLTNLTAGNLTGTIPSAVLGNSTVNIGTTSVALNRASANLALTGISSITLPGSTSGTVQLVPTAAVGTGTVLTIPATTGTIITSGDSGTVNNTMLSGSIALSKFVSGTSGQVIVANASGVPTYTTMSGKVTINSSGVTSINATLDDLSDVVIVSPTLNQVVLYNGSAWVNGASPGGGGGTSASPTSEGILYGKTSLSGGTTFLGYNSGNNSVTGADNIAIGQYSQASVSTGIGNVGMGYGSLRNNATNNYSVAIGYSSLENSLGGYNVGIGYSALKGTVGTASGTFNVAIGANAGYSLQSGQYNIFLGYNSGYSVTTATHNIGIGYNALNDPQGTSNIGIGYGALGSSGGTLTGAYNISVGLNAGMRLQSGSNNIFIGQGAGAYNTTGSRNVFIGYTAGDTEYGSDKLYIANSNTSSPLIKGDFASSTVDINGTLTYRQAFNNQGTNTTVYLSSSDKGKVVTFNSTTNVTVYVNNFANLVAGERIDLLNLGTGTVSISGSGVTVNGTPGLKLRAQYSAGSLLCIANNSSYVLIGDLAA